MMTRGLEPARRSTDASVIFGPVEVLCLAEISSSSTTEFILRTPAGQGTSVLVGASGIFKNPPRAIEKLRCVHRTGILLLSGV
jgi:hypothetical protein